MLYWRHITVVPEWGFFVGNMIKKLQNQALSLLLIANSFHLNIGAFLSFEAVNVQLPSFESSVQMTSLMGDGQLSVFRTMKVVLTAYSSTSDQTDSTPFTTASNTHVRDGIVAANFLPFGTKIRIPELFGEKIFVVEDRMHKRFNDRVDIWFSDRRSAKQFGLKNAEIIVLES